MIDCKMNKKGIVTKKRQKFAAEGPLRYEWRKKDEKAFGYDNRGDGRSF